LALSPSSRIRIIKQVAQSLSSEDWSLIDLTLGQFSLPTQEQWNGTALAYVTAMVASAADDTLEGLAQHFGIESAGEAPGPEPVFWRVGCVRMFLSHLAEFRRFSGDLQIELNSLGVSAFVAHKDIEPSKEWQNEIEAALASAHCLLALMHPGFHKSKWTDQEIGYAMGRSLPVFSVRLGEDPYGFIGRFQAIEGHEKSARALSRAVFDVLAKHKQTKDRLTDAVVSQLENSESFADAKANVGLLENLEFWRPGFAVRLEQAIKQNSQIREAFGVSARIRALIDARET
jgi:hypothetical protein